MGRIPSKRGEVVAQSVLQAEELFGPKTVTDVGGGYIDIEKENTKVTQENTEATKAAAAAAGQVAGELHPRTGGQWCSGRNHDGMVKYEGFAQ